jgi:hypothetical protein
MRNIRKINNSLRGIGVYHVAAIFHLSDIFIACVKKDDRYVSYRSIQWQHNDPIPHALHVVQLRLATMFVEDVAVALPKFPTGVSWMAPSASRYGKPCHSACPCWKLPSVWVYC